MGKKLIIFLIVGGFLYWYQLSQQNLQPQIQPETSNFISASDSNVILYSTKSCSFCRKTRQFFAENAIEYFEYDIETSAQGAREYRQLQGKGVPLLLINSTVIRGYNLNAIKTALN